MHQFSLEELGLVDSEAEPTFDNLTTLASTVVGAPVALFSIVQQDKDRQYFKSRLGLDVQQTPLSHSFCRIVVDTGEALIVDDASSNPLVCDNPAITDLNVRAYLGFPVTDPEGNPIASLCVIDAQSRHWSEHEKRTVQALAACATDAVRLKYEIKRVEMMRQEQRVFAHAIAHDMTAPLNTVSYVMTEVRDELGSHINDDLNTLIQMALGTVDRARNMVGDVMVYSQSFDSDFAPEAVDLNELVDETRDTLKGDIVVVGATLLAESLPIVRGSRIQLAMLFQNIISNALKFHHPSKVPNIHVSAIDEGNHVSICFADNGIGISAKYQKKIFGLFERLHNKDEYAGSGVGLALVQQVVQNHQGSLSVDSDGENGTTFTVRLPRFQHTAN